MEKIWCVTTFAASAHTTDIDSESKNTLTLGRDNISLVLVDNRETMGEVKGLARSDERCHLGPNSLLVGIREQVHDNGSFLGSLKDREKVLAWNPAFFNSLVEGLAFTLTNDDIDTIVTQVQSLTTALGTIAKNSNGIILEGLKQLFTGNIGALINGFLNTTKVKGLVTAHRSHLKYTPSEWRALDHMGHNTLLTEALTAVCFKLAEAIAATGRATAGTIARREAARRAVAKTREAIFWKKWKRKTMWRKMQHAQSVSLF